LVAEIDQTRLDPGRLVIDERAFVITAEDREAESRSGLVETIGSTGSGTGAAVQRRVGRRVGTARVQDVVELREYIADSTPLLRRLLRQGERVILEGTQGFGLSLLHSHDYPFVTSRDTTAAGVVSEAGLSPLDVDQIVLVLRAFPIRVGGRSGPLPDEVNWETLTAEGGHEQPLEEFTSVTGRLRRVAHFDAEIVRQAIAVNIPSMIAMNHVDYVDADCVALGGLTEKARKFVADVSSAIDAPIDLVGIGPTKMLSFKHPLVSIAS
jgi:adenylosuccinate synthase